MDLQKEFKADAKKANEGVWVDVNGGEFKLTYYNSTIAQMTFRSLVEKERVSTDRKNAVINAMHQTLIEEIVLDWKGIDEKGVELKYSKDELERILKKYIGLDAVIMARAVDIDNFKREEKEEKIKN